MKSKPARLRAIEGQGAGHLGGSVQALERGLNLLTLIAESDGLSLTSLAQRAGIAPSTAHRILATLKASRFVQCDNDHGEYFVGVQAFRVGSAFLRNRKIVDAGRSTLRRLMEASGETVNLAIENDGRIMFVSQFESHQTIRAFHRPGASGPMHASSVGKAMLATRSDEAVAQLLHHVGMAKFTRRTIVDPDALLQELATIRRRGWAIDDEEQSEGMRCIGAAIFNEHSDVIGAVSIAGPVVRLTDERMGELGPMVKRAAADITQRVGGRLPEA